jgi:uncharacterized membrane protein YhaH (DUF805 family)|tara:strand:- start:74 stop:451 length:378 start_codon:yes stop_codon:yes gene_type:complete
MNMKEAVISVLTNWKNFQGRASRSEYWYFALAGFLLYTLVILLEFATGIVELGSDEMGIFSLTIRYLLGILSLAVTSRRLQDRGYSGWWQLSYLIIIGIFVIPLLCILPAKEDENKWGRNPLLDM